MKHTHHVLKCFYIFLNCFDVFWNVVKRFQYSNCASNIIKPATTGRACPRSPPALGNTKRVHPNAAHIIPDGAVMTGSFVAIRCESCLALSSSQFMTKRAERIGKIWKHSEANLNKPKRHSHGTDRRIVIEPRDTAWPPNFPRFIPRRCGPHSTTWVSRCVNRFFMFFHVFSWLFSLFTVKKFKIYQYLFRNDSEGFTCFRSNCECTPITYPWFLFKIVHTHSLFTIVLCYKYYKFI
jgi:hypothetical protein